MESRVNMSRISVLMSVKDGQRFLNESLEAIRRNIRRDDEVIVVDDGSTDKTLHILNSSARIFPQLRILRNNGSGLVDALNLGIQAASNDWIARFDVDDRYSTSRLEDERSMISSNIIGIFSDYSIWTDKSRFLGLIPSPVLPLATGISLIRSQRTAHPSALINRSAVLDVGGYRREDFPAEDISLWLRLLRVGSLVSCPKELLYYRISSTSVSGVQYGLAKSKTNELVRTLGLPQGFLSEAINSCEHSLESYKALSKSNDRSVLHLNEIRHAIKIFGVSRQEQVSFQKNLMTLATDPQNYLSAVDLGQWKARRFITQFSSRSRSFFPKSN
jgi:glycosyltransferase involved in cell wall biosynthesis